MKKTIIFLVAITCMHSSLQSQVWQWSVKVDSVISPETSDHPQAFLWVPEKCRRVRGVIFTQHNMVEEGMLEHPHFRKTMEDLNFAEVWVTPGLSVTFDFTKDAPADFDYMMKLLADVSGYKELAFAPVIPMGHSALASFPWNFGAWNPGRTLALVSVHGDAPQTHLTGSGRPNPDWGSRNIDGIPSLFIMGEYEWWEDRLSPAFEYISKHPKSTITLFADAGHGHFDYSDELIEYVCLFIRKAAAKRLPAKQNSGSPIALKLLKPKDGWLMDRWHKDSLPLAPSAPFSKYRGNRRFASWVFDKEMADATDRFYARARGKVNQYIGFRQSGTILKPNKSHAIYNMAFKPRADGISFTLESFFADSSRIVPAKEFAKTPLVIERICGPVKKIDDTTFRISFYRMGFNNPKRSNDIWLLASNKGDEKFKSAVQQLNMRFPLTNKDGDDQRIEFAKIGDQPCGVGSIALNGVSSAGMPVYYYVKEGPAYIDNNTLIVTGIPPKSKFPVKITVVAWQYGRSTEPKVKSAQPVEQSFYIRK